MSQDQVRNWIEDLSKQSFVSEDLFDSLLDGVQLCKVVAKLKGKFVSFNRNPKNQEEEIENFTTFTETLSTIGYKPSDLKFTYQNLKLKTHKADILSFFSEISEVAKKGGKYKGPFLEDMKTTLDHKVFEKKESFATLSGSPGR
jgi:hypothetical protein